MVNRPGGSWLSVDRSGMQRREIVPLRYAARKSFDMLNNPNNEEQKGQNAPTAGDKVWWPMMKPTVA